MNPTILAVIGPGFLNQVPTLGFLPKGSIRFALDSKGSLKAFRG